MRFLIYLVCVGVTAVGFLLVTGCDEDYVLDEGTVIKAERIEHQDCLQYQSQSYFRTNEEGNVKRKTRDVCVKHQTRFEYKYVVSSDGKEMELFRDENLYRVGDEYKKQE